MGSFFLFILIVFFAIIGLIGAFVLRFVRLFTKQTSGFNNSRSTQNNRYDDQQGQRSHNENNHQKIFSKEEGEYIDYEEVK
ncbi:uncharacterized protein DUF4834 [Dysgonomonas alginatilytica]|uniref:Uncharacterized protein DUF4834 n=1 Tax=Dysgonomonas alginatilytica TaxID=1605892 RepID=A0A2V3PUH3_9BACT|nr:DUF4834 family protein [Dysgonomonas alginatilytica]PXV67540.1 uncharacterized protein DUF4834 [Dysgonomonas alginatilytica]